MKLIRCTTESPDGIFSNTFNTDIIIEPYSKIALHSLTTQISTEQILIDVQNNKIDFEIATVPRTILLNYGTYDKSNIDDFFNDITYKFNNSLQYNESEVGRQFLASTSANKFTLQLRTGTIIDPVKNFNNQNYNKFIASKNVQVISTGGNLRMTRLGGTDTNMDSFVYINSPISKGCGTLRSRVYSNTNTTNGGYVIAYLNKPLDATTAVIQPSDIVFGIRFVDSTQVYKIYKNGSESSTTVTPIITGNTGQATNDLITLDSYGGQLRANVWNTTTGSGRTNGLLIDSIPFDHTTNLWPVVIFVSGQTTVSNINFTTDPFYNDINNVKSDIDENNIGAIVALKTNKVVKTYLQFNDLDLAKTLGFKSQRIPNNSDEFLYTNPSTGILEYKASSGLIFRDLADSYVIQMLNLPIQSYDSIKQQHMNIISVIPQFDQIRERLIYVSPYPLFLSLNNSTRINLREIKMRILKEDLTSIITTGYSQITLLIDN